MCGRFAFDSSIQELIKEFKIKKIELKIERNKNIAPSMEIPVIINNNNENELSKFIWGIKIKISSEKKEVNLINTKIESLLNNYLYKNFLEFKRCLVPATGFYEWKKNEEKNRKDKYLIRIKNKVLFAFAAIYIEKSDETERKKFFSILTEPAEKTISHIHNRMPVILTDEKEYLLWLNENNKQLENILEKIRKEKDFVYDISE
ncbi:MAG TPA: SOS response-associated peptidase family protein [bacterium]|nr:SOS response-associated peptidase family protein [bacterium]HPQ18071.1 SOS response-associated peptidase family protein [bacterium]